MRTNAGRAERWVEGPTLDFELNTEGRRRQKKKKKKDPGRLKISSLVQLERHGPLKGPLAILLGFCIKCNQGRSETTKLDNPRA